MRIIGELKKNPGAAPQTRIHCSRWWHISVIPALGRLRQENSEFKSNLGYIVSLRAD
jgi:hypothetical protein